MKKKISGWIFFVHKKRRERSAHVANFESSKRSEWGWGFYLVDNKEWGLYLVDKREL